MSKHALGRLCALLLAAGLAVLLGLGGVSVFLVRRTRDFTRSVTDLQSARIATTLAFRRLQDAETGQRGYLLTRDPAYLQPYTRAVSTIADDLDVLQRRMVAVPAAIGTARAFAETSRRKLAELARTVALEQSGAHGAALALMGTDMGRDLMDRARGETDEILKWIDTGRNRERRALLTRNAMLLAVTWCGLGTVLLVACAAGFVVVRYLREMEAAERLGRDANALLERRVRERTAELESVNEEVQRFAYIVSHDLRAPLVNIMGFASELAAVAPVLESLLQRAQAVPGLDVADARVAVEQDLPEALGFIRNATGRMDRLINAILKLSREGRRNLVPERLDPAEIARGIAASLQHQLDETETRLEIEPMPALVSDRLALEQLLGNLIDNAVKYLVPNRPGRIAVRGREEDGRVLIEVEDNGRGIAERDRERVFELFRRAGAQDRPGEGIGLAHVRALVRRLDGTIGFTSRPNEGTVFTLCLPCLPYPPGAAPGRRTDEPAGKPAGTPT